jgi:general secretion pathway protein K
MTVPVEPEMVRRDGERGFALVAAVASILVLSAFAVAVMAATRREVIAGVSEIDRARASAAVDAGMAIALSRLATDDLSGVWPFDSRLHTATFDAWRLDMRVADERGKVPLNLLDDGQVTRLLERAGLSGQALKIAHDSYLDWIDDDDDPGPDGAESDYYQHLGIRPRNGYMKTVGELRRVRGLDARTVERIATVGTVDFGSGAFDTRTAQPGAIGVMFDGGDANPEAIEAAREAAGQVTALGFVSQKDRIGRPLSITVTASAPDGARLSRRCLIELTGAHARPFVVRYCE